MRCLDITCLCILSFLLKDFRRQNRTNYLISTPQEQNVDREKGRMLRIYIGFQAKKFHCFPPTRPPLSPPPHFYCFSFHHRHHISVVFPTPPLPPPPHFYCFPYTTTTTTTFLLLFSTRDIYRISWRENNRNVVAVVVVQENNRNVVAAAVVVVVVVEENNRNVVAVAVVVVVVVEGKQ